jgi:uncharacterized membrane protein YphA (DoxX/SURF4 family)
MRLETSSLRRLDQRGRTAELAPPEEAEQRHSSAGIRIALFRIGFGLFWVVNAWYKWQPDFQKQFAVMLTHTPKGAPGWATAWMHFWGARAAANPALFGPGVAAIETVVAVALILGFARRPLYLLGALFSFMIWSVPEAFGRFWQAGQTDLGDSIMYCFIFLALLLVDTGPAGGSWSVDRWIDARLPWWRHISGS